MNPKHFKFFQRIKVIRSEPGFVKLKDAYNRNKILMCDWSEYPVDQYVHNIRTFQGNILEFYNMVANMNVYPTVYEIHKQHRGYFDASIVFDNRNRYNLFIKRKFYLTIKYSLL